MRTRVLTSLICLLATCGLLNGQCVGSTTMLFKVRHILRTGGNNVEALAGSQVVGDYYATWQTSVSSTETGPAGTIHTGSNSVGYGASDDSTVGGTYSHLLWNDAPSSRGAGTYTLSSSHTFVSMCSDNVLDSSSVSLAVYKPTITGSLFAFWNLGPGSADPTTSSTYSNDSYVQHADLSIDTHCTGTDVCTDTPQWSTSSSTQAALSSSSGTSTVLNHTSARGNCSYDTQVTVSIGGFASDPVAFAVNSPSFLVHNGTFDHTDPFGSGYLTFWNYAIADACSPANAIPSLPVYEVFSGFSNPGVISGWGDPVPSSSSDFLTSLYIFTDGIGNRNLSGTSNPAPTWTSSNSPFTYNTVIKYGGQTWNAGLTSSGGWSVGSGTISYYQDHGDGQ